MLRADGARDSTSQVFTNELAQLRHPACGGGSWRACRWDVLFAVSRAGDPLTLLRLDSLVPKKLDAPRKWLQRAKQVYEVRRRMESRELGPSLVLLETRRPPCFNPFGRTEHDERDAMR